MVSLHFLICFLCALLGPIHAGRSTRLNLDAAGDEGEENVEYRSTNSKHFEVELVVTRHALSCANIVKDWGPGGSALQKVVDDPILSGAGEDGSIAMGKHTRDAGIEVDAVVASVLLRSVQTALYQYPGHDVYIMPYIRETGASFPNPKNWFKKGNEHNRIEIGTDNWPLPETEQKNKMADANSASRNSELINGKIHWLSETAPFDNPDKLGQVVESLKQSLGDWEAFLKYFGEEFLPTLTEGKESGSKITVAVVTHSMFMKDKEFDIYKDCNQHWKGAGNNRPLNNQAVAMRYDATLDDTGNTYSLKKHPSACRAVAPGMKYDKDKRLCERDIGKVCYADLKEAVWKFMPKVAEKKMEDIRDKYAHSGPDGNAQTLQAAMEMNELTCTDGKAPGKERTFSED